LAGKTRISLALAAARHPAVAGIVLLFVSLLLLVGVDYSARAARVHALPTSDLVVALTFDDGPDERYTQRVLDILGEQGVPGTFFLIGSKVAAAEVLPDYSGHLIGYHTYSHEKMLRMGPLAQVAEFQRGIAATPDFVTCGRGYYRSPRGECWPTTVLWACTRGVYLSWDVCYDAKIRARNSDGSRGNVLPQQQRVTAVLEAIQPGSVVLMHDGNSNGRYLVEDLPVIIAELRAQGYRFSTPEEFFGSGCP